MKRDSNKERDLEVQRAMRKYRSSIRIVGTTSEADWNDLFELQRVRGDLDKIQEMVPQQDKD